MGVRAQVVAAPVRAPDFTDEEIQILKLVVTAARNRSQGTPAVVPPASRLVIEGEAPAHGQAAPAEPPAQPRMPETVQVVDNPDIETAISQWADRFDAERNLNYGN